MKGLLVAALTLLLAACATPYGAPGIMGGVSAAPLGNDVYRVQAQLNGFSNPSMVQDYLLLKAAETAVEQGAVGFVIIDARDTSTAGQIITPGYANTTATVSTFGNTAYGTANTTYTPSQAYGYIRPGGILTIGLVRQAPPNGAYFNAQEIISAIGSRIRR